MNHIGIERELIDLGDETVGVMYFDPAPNMTHMRIYTKSGQGVTLQMDTLKLLYAYLNTLAVKWE